MGMWCRGLTCDPVKVETAGSNPVIPATEPPMSYIGGFRICMHTIIHTTETVQSASCSPQHPICDSGNALHRSLPAPALHPAHFCGAARGGRLGLDPVGVPRTLFSSSRSKESLCNILHGHDPWSVGDHQPALSLRCNGQQHHINPF